MHYRFETASKIFNTDQGSQFTGAAFTGLLQRHGIAISKNGRGAWRDNVFVERLWRSAKYEEVYPRAYDSVGDAQTGCLIVVDMVWGPAKWRHFYLYAILDIYSRGSSDGMSPMPRPPPGSSATSG